MTPGFPVSLFERIAETMDCELLLETERSGPAPGTDPFADGRADFGWICSTSFVDLATRQQHPTIELAGAAWVPLDEGSGHQPIYFGDVVVRADSPYRRLEDLAGRRVGCNDEISLSGHYAFRLAVHDAGADPDTFADLVFTGGHHQSLDLLLDGQLDAATVDSVVRTSRSADDVGVDGLRVLGRLGPWPVQPLVARTGLDPEIRRGAVSALLGSSKDPAMQSELRAAGLCCFVPVERDHYATIREAMARLG